MSALDMVAMARSGKGGSGGGVSKDYVDEQISDVRAEYPIADTVSGDDISVTGTADANVQKLTIYGRSEVVNNNIFTTTGSTNGHYLISDGTTRSSEGWRYSDYLVIPATNYLTFSYTSSLTANAASLCFYDENKEFISGEAYSNRTNITFTVPVNAKYCRLSYASSWTSSLTLLADATIYSIGDNGSLTITTANSDSSESSTATLTTGLPLCGIPVNSGETYTDGDGVKWLADSVDDDGIVKRCWKITLDGSEEWATESSSPEINESKRCYMLLSDDKKAPLLDPTTITPKAICNNMEVKSPSYTYNKGAGISVTGNRIQVRIDNISTSTDLKTYLASNPVTIVYMLATPTTTPLTPAEKSALLSLKTYDPTTNVTVTDDPTVDVGYLLNTGNGQAVADVQNGLQGQILYYVAGQGKINSILNHTYQGEALTDLYANEIQADYDNPWQWITARTAADNFSGINVADFIPTTIKTYSLNPQIAGIKTYTGYGDTAVGKHIDWISKELYPELHAINKVNYNNGTADQNHAWLASDAYLYVNSLAGNVPNGTALNPETVAVDYTADGIYYYLPQQLKNVIIEKRFLLPKRYSASGLLTEDNQWAWVNIGKLWFPDECEVYGMPVWGGKGGYSLGGSGLQYPIFAGNMNRLKYRNGSRNSWWLLSPYEGSFSNWCNAYNYGHCSRDGASDAHIGCPVCFRTGETYSA